MQKSSENFFKILHVNSINFHLYNLKSLCHSNKNLQVTVKLKGMLKYINEIYFKLNLECSLKIEKKKKCSKLGNKML